MERRSVFSIFRTSVTIILLAMSVAAPVSAAVTVVNMMPNLQSGETNQDSEPNISVDSANPNRIAGSAFTRGTGVCTANTAPIYRSVDGGSTWDWACIVPSAPSGTAGFCFDMTCDITLRFASSGGILYAGILREPRTNAALRRLNILRTTDFTTNTLMGVLVDTSTDNPDQPYIEATTSGTDDRVYVGHNDTGATADQTARIEHSRNADAAAPAFVQTTVERRTTCCQDAPAVRTVAHTDGTVYSVFYRWTASAAITGGTSFTSDVVIVRDDNGGAGANPFQALVEPVAPAGDGLVGVRVVRGRAVPFINSNQANFGLERFVASNLSIAVDPRNSNTVYVAWADRVGANDYTLHVRRSTNRGQTWSTTDLRTITDATNPALAINSVGKVGFLYQQLTGRGTASPRWVTRLERTTDGFTTHTTLVLADTPANAPAAQFGPYLGDYVHLQTLGRTFYGIFSANNTPDTTNFPNGVTYQRNANFTTHALLANDNVTPVAVSIDPFFFRVTEPFIDICRLNPRLCRGPIVGRDLVELRCELRDCLIVDPIPKNCLVKWGGGCPGCGPGGLCPPYYNVYLDGIVDIWDVDLVDSRDNPVVHEQFRTKTGIVLSFRPSKEEYIDGQIGNYRLVFAMGKAAKVGETYAIKTRVERSNRPFGQAKR